MICSLPFRRNAASAEKREKTLKKQFTFAILAIGIVVLLLGHLRVVSSEIRETFPFPHLNGWKLAGEIETFLPETLFDYIDGGADLFLRYDFEELKVAQYENEKGASLTVEVYRHRSPVHAFGIYSQERPPDARIVPIGTQGYYEKDLLNFIAGPYYVKVSGFKIDSENQTVLTLVARKVSEALGEKTSLPSNLSLFPGEGKRQNSETFVARNFLGYTFLHSAYTAEYEVWGKRFRLFLIEGADQKECREMIESYLRELGKPRSEVREGPYRFDDPHHGVIDLYWNGTYLWGILDLGDPDLRTKYMGLFKEMLEKR